MVQKELLCVFDYSMEQRLPSCLECVLTPSMRSPGVGGQDKGVCVCVCGVCKSETETGRQRRGGRYIIVAKYSNSIEVKSENLL